MITKISFDEQSNHTQRLLDLQDKLNEVIEVMNVLTPEPNTGFHDFHAKAMEGFFGDKLQTYKPKK